MAEPTCPNCGDHGFTAKTYEVGGIGVFILVYCEHCGRIVGCFCQS